LRAEVVCHNALECASIHALTVALERQPKVKLATRSRVANGARGHRGQNVVSLVAQEVLHIGRGNAAAQKE
ncbi:hypothetical protein NECAME_18424, partial [Necator americanus]